MSSDYAIEVNNVSKVYRIYNRPSDRLRSTLFANKNLHKDFWALKDVSFQVKRGETVGIVGKNGSGKSTILQIIAGTLAQSSGSVSVSGRVAALLELGSGFNPEFSGKENVYMSGAVLGMSRAEMDSYYDDILAFADIGEFINQPVKTYSSGMAVRLAFAVQAMVPKDIFIVDEALAVGDELFQRKCFAKLEEFRDRGGTTLFVSHSGGTVIELCDRAVLLDEGESILVGSSKHVVMIYQKLVYAPVDARSEIRRGIMRESTESSDETTASCQVDEPPVELNNQSIESMYDPNMIPQSSLSYENRGATIIDPEILTMDGDRVNILVSHRTYVFRYKVHFEYDFRGVRFGMLVRTSSGMDLGGGVSVVPGQKGIDVEAGQSLVIQFKFTPNLNAGMYFMNAGVLSSFDGDEVFLDRKVDILAFKMIPESVNRSTSIVDFQMEVSVEQYRD